VSEAESEIPYCLRKGAHAVQVDFTEARLSLKLDPSKQLLRSFIDLNNRVLDAPFTDMRSEDFRPGGRLADAPGPGAPTRSA
jgi:hypothetical protein